jgi:hypothetical protein
VPLAEYVGKGVFVDERTSRYVDEYCIGFHPP